MPATANRHRRRFNRRTKSTSFNPPTNSARRNAAVALLVALLSVMPTNIALGAVVTYDLAPDTGFGAGGRTVVDLGSRYEEGRAMAIQSDGKVVIVGKTQSPDGQLVRSVGGGHFSTTCMEETPDVLSRIDFVVARFSADGTLDTSFGSGGKVLTDLGAEDEAEAVAVQPDGKIVVVGVTYVSFYAFSHGAQPFRKIALARYNVNGSLDASFGSGGVVVTDYVPGSGVPTAVALSDGKIIITRPNFALTRFNGDGSLDTTFGVNGTAAAHFSDGDSVSALVVQADKKIVAVGSATVNGKSAFAVTRFNSNGSLDTTFGNGGASPVAFPNSSTEARSVVLQSDGKVVVAGSIFQPTTFNGYWDFALARYNADGSLDTTFGISGVATAPVSETSCGLRCGATSLSLQPNGRILAVSRRFVARFKRNGMPDNDFGFLGVSTLGSFDEFTGALAQFDDRIILAGGVTSAIPGVFFTDKTCGNGDILLARYKVVVQVIDDGDPIGDDGIPIDAPDVVKLYAPLVFLHSDDDYRPANASSYILNSNLVWAHKGEIPQVSSCEPDTVAGWGTTVEIRLGNPLDQTGDPGAASLPAYSHQVRNLLSCQHSARFLTTRDYTRPFDEAKRRNILASDIYKREGFYLDPLNDDLFRKGAANRSSQPDSEYVGAPVYYEYVPQQYITYWFFYAYNNFDGPLVFNQKHEGDWEQVSIHLDCENKPLEIAYYKHGGADPFPWPSSAGNVPNGQESVTLVGTHPIVYSARGSHASYPTLGAHTFVVKAPLTGTEIPVSDHTNSGLPWKTWRALRPVKKQGWYGYGGSWGEVGEAEYTTGPLGPSRYKSAHPSFWASPSTCLSQ